MVAALNSREMQALAYFSGEERTHTPHRQLPQDYQLCDVTGLLQ